MPEQKETIVCNLNARKLAECGGIMRNRLKAKTGSMDLTKLDTGLKLPDNYLNIGAQQPTLAELTVLAAKLGLQIRITSLELVTSEQIAAENAAAKQTAGK